MTRNFQPDFTLEYIFETLNDLPAFPKAVNKAMKLLDDPKATMARLAEILRYDQTLTANILKFTNSAHFGLPQQVTNLETALALLGEQQIRQILIASASLPYMTKPLDGYAMTPKDLWCHAMGCAIVSEVLASCCNYSNPPVLFTAAILHDIGKIVMNLYVGPRLKEIVELANREDIDFTEAEWRVVGADHAVIGYNLLRYWEFPPDIARAVRNHHDPDLYLQDELSALLALSNIMTVQLGIGVGADGFRYSLAQGLLERLGLQIEDINICMRKALEEYDKARDMLTF